MEKERNYGIELLRIVSMLMIVMIHIVNRGGMAENAEGFNKYVLFAINAIIACAVNCYAMISGYVGLYTGFKLSRLLKLWVQVFVYSLGIALIFYFVKPNGLEIGMTELIKACLPMTVEQYWYFTAYFGMFFLTPVLNRIIYNTEQRVLKLSMAAIFAIYSIYATVSLHDIFKLNVGCSVWWLSFMYVVGGYIRKYKIDEKIRKFGGGLYILSVGTIFISMTAIELVNRILPIELNERLFSYNTTPLVVLEAIGLLVFFSQKKLRKNTLIRFFAPVSFGVYLIHTHPLIYSYILKNVFVGYISYNALTMLLLSMATMLAIYVLCSLVDFVRIKIFARLRVGKLCDKAGAYIEKSANKFIDKF